MAANKPKDITACPDWGKGGSYTLDPLTGIRTLVQRTESAPADNIAPAAAPSVPPAPVSTPPTDQSVTKGA